MREQNEKKKGRNRVREDRVSKGRYRGREKRWRD